jgi:hypothetical protein
MELGGNWIVATIIVKVATITVKVTIIITKVATITTKVATIPQNLYRLTSHSPGKQQKTTISGRRQNPYVTYALVVLEFLS